MKDIKGLIIKNKGAMTLEAALVLPVLLCAFFTVIFLIKAVFTVEMVQHALDETAAEIASAGYIYHISGIRDMHDTARNNINDKSDLFKDQINSVFESYNSFTGLVDNIDKGIAGVPDSAELIQQAEENFGSMLNHAETAVSDPINELKAIACFIAGDSFNDAKTQLFTPVVKLYMKKYLVTDSMPDADKRLKIFNISDGFAGLDFSESTFLSDRKENIDIIVKYRIDLPLPFRFTDGLVIVQRARVKAWMGGDDSQGVLKGNSTNNTDDIWSLSNFQRGLKIRRLFGANLPNSYPVIAKYENGKAVMIKSMDLTAVSYQKGNQAAKTIEEYLVELVEFKGQHKPWGKDGIVIEKNGIKTRELVLVIPQNELSEANKRMLTDMSAIADSKGIRLIVEKYGIKVIEGTETDTETDTETNTETNTETKP